MGLHTGRVAIVSGGGRGIGRAIALGLAADGHDVAINYRRDEAAAEATAAEILAMGCRSLAYAADVTDFAQCETMVNAVEDDLGPISILVNNAGVASKGQSVKSTDPQEPLRLFNAHAYAAWSLSKLVLPSMRTQPRGDIVMISSASTVYLAPNGAPYNMAKAALEALAATLAKEERRNGIHVNTIAPGLVDTDMGRRLVKGAAGVDDIRTLDASASFGHVCTPEEIADAVCWIVSERASYVTGQRIGVDGGTF